MGDFEKIILASMFSFLFGAIVAIFAEPFRRWLFRSSVILSFEPKIGFGRRWIYLAPTTKPKVSAKYIRVLATCSARTTANLCKPFLTRIEKHDSTLGGYKELHHDPLPLNWAFIGDQQWDIHPEMAFYFDVFRVHSDDNSICPQTTISPETWTKLIQEPGRYRFTVVLAGENIGPPVSRKIEFEWKGTFDSLTEDCFVSAS